MTHQAMNNITTENSGQLGYSAVYAAIFPKVSYRIADTQTRSIAQRYRQRETLIFLPSTFGIFDSSGSTERSRAPGIHRDPPQDPSLRAIGAHAAEEVIEKGGKKKERSARGKEKRGEGKRGSDHSAVPEIRAADPPWQVKKPLIATLDSIAMLSAGAFPSQPHWCRRPSPHEYPPPGFLGNASFTLVSTLAHGKPLSIRRPVPPDGPTDPLSPSPPLALPPFFPPRLPSQPATATLRPREAVREREALASDR